MVLAITHKDKLMIPTVMLSLLWVSMLVVLFTEASSDFIVVVDTAVDGYANLEAAVSSQSGLVLQQLVRAERRKAVFSFLNNRSHHVLAPVLEGLRVILGNSLKGPLRSENKVEAFWITNCVAIQIPAIKNNEEADKLRMVLETGLRQNVVGRASITDIRVIHDMFSPHMRLHSSPLSSSFSTVSTPSSFQDTQWNIAKVRAP